MNTPCSHLLVWYFVTPYRYRCLKCLKKFKIASGVLLPDEKQRDWFNAHGNRWPWQEEFECKPSGG